jgi:hypothetical protein
MRILSVDRRTPRRARELLAVRAGLSAWCVVGLLFLTYPLLPGADHDHTAVLLAAGTAALAWALTVSLPPAAA